MPFDCTHLEKLIYSPAIGQSETAGVFVPKDIAMQVQSPLRGERNKAFKRIGLQAISVLIVGLIWLITKGRTPGFCALLGGAASLIPGCLLTGYLFATVSPRAGKRMAITFALGEFAKLIISGFAIGFLIIRLPAAMVPILTGFAGALVGLWLAPLFIDVDRQNERVNN